MGEHLAFEIAGAALICMMLASYPLAVPSGGLAPNFGRAQKISLVGVIVCLVIFFAAMSVQVWQLAVS